MKKDDEFRLVEKAIEDSLKARNVPPDKFLSGLAESLKKKPSDCLEVLHNYLVALLVRHNGTQTARQYFEDFIFDVFQENKKEDMIIFFAMYLENLFDMLFFDITTGDKVKTVWEEPRGVLSFPPEPRLRMLHRQKELFHIAQSNLPLLIIGETGTGKEVMAKVFHKMSKYRRKEMVTVNCAAIPENLLESELFGHEKGAFYGANSPRKGRIEIANESTLFLDELGKMPKPLQAKLLRFIEDKTNYRLGSNTPIKINCRIMAATQPHHIQKDILPDLLYRLTYPFSIKIPTLNERMRESPGMVLAFALKSISQKLKLNKEIFTSDTAAKILENHHFEGNYRELSNILKIAIHIAAASNRDTIQAEDLQWISQKTPKRDELDSIPLKDIFEHADKVAASIIERKIKQVYQDGNDVKNTLKEEGWTTTYQNFLNRLRKATGKDITGIVQSEPVEL